MTDQRTATERAAVNRIQAELARTAREIETRQAAVTTESQRLRADRRAWLSHYYLTADLAAVTRTAV